MKKPKNISFAIPREEAELYLENACEHAAATARRIVNAMPLPARWDFCARCIEAWIQSEALAAVAKKNRAKKLIRTIEAFDEKNPSTCDIQLTLSYSWDSYREENPINPQEENS